MASGRCRLELRLDFHRCVLQDVTTLTYELERETDGRWIAEVPEVPGVMAYGESREEAIRAACALALRVIADQVEHGERPAL